MTFGCHGEIVQTDFVQVQMNPLAPAACPMNWQTFACAGIASLSARYVGSLQCSRDGHTTEC